MQSARDLSLPVHFTLSTWMGPFPSPKYAIVLALAEPLEKVIARDIIGAMAAHKIYNL